MHDVSGKIVMAGAIDIHSHIGGGNENIARLLLPKCIGRRAAPAFLAARDGQMVDVRDRLPLCPMGFTTVIEPAVAPHQAIQAHLELSDIPIIDKGTLTVLGNDDFLLSLLRDGEGAAAIADYVGIDSRGEQRSRGQMSSTPAARPRSNTMRGLSASTTSCPSTVKPHAKSSSLCSGR